MSSKAKKLSSDPFMTKELITINATGTLPNFGIVLKDCDQWNNRIVIQQCQVGSPFRNIRSWIKRIKSAYLLEINNIPVTSVQTATEQLNKIRAASESTFTITVDANYKQSIHHEEGVPLLYFDQLNMINNHLQDIQHNTTTTVSPTIQTINNSSILQNKYINQLMQAPTINAPQAILPKNKRSSTRLTQQKLKVLDTWPEWQASEWKQLDQYKGQDTFGKSCPLPVGANVLDLLWTYLIKDEQEGKKRFKARCVCNGKPSNKNTVIFGYTFAKMLDHVGSRIFWATAASKNFIVRGADASNAFAEAQAPKIPLYVRIDTPFREWWTNYKRRPPIPEGYVLPVHKALQGHPESSRSWAILIDTILRKDLNLKPTTHEPCLYYGTFKGRKILFLRQVDDFAIACPDEDLAKKVIDEINKHM